jgi:hypothetical protein
MRHYGLHSSLTEAPALMPLLFSTRGGTYPVLGIVIKNLITQPPKNSTGFDATAVFVDKLSNMTHIEPYRAIDAAGAKEWGTQLSPLPSQ